VYNANSEVSNLLGGIDILTTKPLDITDATAVNSGGATAIAYAAYSAAIAALADTSSGNPDINGVLTTLESSFSGGIILADDSGANDAVISLQEIIDGATSTLTQAGTVDTSGTIAALQADVDAAAGGSVDPEPSSTAGSTALTKVKTFVSDIRTWGNVIQAEMQDSANAFADQAELASTAANATGDLLMGPALNATVEAIGMNFQGVNTNADLSTYGLGFASGTIENTAGTITITDGLINDVTVNMEAQIPQDGTNATSFTVAITSATLTSTAADAEISGTISITTVSGYTIDWGAIDAGTATQPDISGGSADLDVSLTQKQDQNGADLPADVTFSGSLAVTLTNPIKDANDEYIWITPASLTLSGNVSSSDGHSLNVTLTANITNANSFAPQDSLPDGYIRSDIVAWTYADTDTTLGDDTFTLTTPDPEVIIYFDGGTAFVTESWSDGSGASYQFDGAQDLYDAIGTAIGTCAYGQSTQKLCDFTADLFYNQYIWVEGEGGYYVDIFSSNPNQDGSVDGVLVDPEFVVEGPGAGEWLDADVGLTFTLQLDGLPEASVTISADRTAYESGTGSITIAYGTRQIVISGSVTDGVTTNSITITNQDNVTVTITNFDNDMEPANITYNGNTYATIKELSNGVLKIEYIDGTFELF
jgi:hypothetical protein